MFFKRNAAAEQLNEGAVFERAREHNLTEQATVTWVGKDPFGIPHVRFRVTIPGFDEADDYRVLAVDVFRERYRRCRSSQAA